MSGRILVVGGAGYIGSHMIKLLLAQGEEPIVLDDLSTGHRDAVLPGATFVQGSSGDAAMLDRVFERYDIDTVTHFASSINVAESVVQPAATTTTTSAIRWCCWTRWRGTAFPISSSLRQQRSSAIRRPCRSTNDTGRRRSILTADQNG
jgi:hypothetical protein